MKNRKNPEIFTSQDLLLLIVTLSNIEVSFYHIEPIEISLRIFANAQAVAF